MLHDSNDLDTGLCVVVARCRMRGDGRSIQTTGGQGATELPGTFVGTRWNGFTESYPQRSSVGRTIAESGRRSRQGAAT